MAEAQIEDNRGTWVVWGIAAAILFLHVATNGRYGFHRDELQFLSDARHLDWGFVAYPPVTPFIERVSLHIFGLSLVGLRMASVIAQALAIVVTAAMARRLGAGRLGQIAAALAIALSPLPLFEGTEFQYSSFDYLWWTLASYCLVRLLTTEDARWWLGIAAAVGVSAMTKYTVVFFVAGLLLGMLCTPARRMLATRWFALGILLTLAICGPNLWWQWRHGWVSLHFLQHIHTRDVGQGRAAGFLQKQFIICLNLAAAPLCLLGVWASLRERRLRALGLLFVFTMAMFWAAKGRSYYAAALYPVVIAVGGMAGERWVRGLNEKVRLAIATVYFAAVIGIGGFASGQIIPFAASGKLRSYALEHNGDLREEIGWDELVRKVAEIRATMPPTENVGVIVGNYGEAGAVEMLGPRYGLPAPISMTNSAWLRSYPSNPPQALIVVGMSEKQANGMFVGCRWAGKNGNAEDIRNEESAEHPDIFVCGPPRKPWAEFWGEHPWFG